MTSGDINQNNYKIALRRQADKLSTYSIAVKETECDLGDLDAVARLLNVSREREPIAARLTAFENICHLLSHLSVEDLRPTERKLFNEYAQIASLLDRHMLTFASKLEYEEGRQNSRNWIEEHQIRADYSGELPGIAAMFERSLPADSSAA